MTEKLEEKFFKTFDIEPRLVEPCTKPRHKCPERFVKDCSECPRAWRKYPQITDHILLELICVALNTFETFEVNRLMKIDSLKEKILELLMLAQDDVYKEVQTVFKEK